MMKKILSLSLFLIITIVTTGQTTLAEAVNFQVKTIYSEPIWLFPLLDDQNKIVVIDFFSTSCGPCQDYAPDFQACYEKFGNNEGNTYFMGINWGNDNTGVYEFDSIFGLTYPSSSGTQGGGNIVCQDYNILSYPTIIIILPDHSIIEQYIWIPDEETITNAVIAAGGIMVNTPEINIVDPSATFFPNPVSKNGHVKLNITESSMINVSVINLLGQEVVSSNPEYYNKGEAVIGFSVEKLVNGYYFIIIKSESEIIATSRISVYQ